MLASHIFLVLSTKVFVFTLECFITSRLVCFRQRRHIGFTRRKWVIFFTPVLQQVTPGDPGMPLVLNIHRQTVQQDKLPDFSVQ